MSDEVTVIYGSGEAVAVVDAASTQLQLAFPNLRPTLKDFIHNDGTQERLACLCGTVPTRPETPNGAVYNIPVDVWLPARFPRAAPMMYVIGTSTVGIRTSPIVDTSGKVTIKLPYFFWDPDEAYPAAAVVSLVEQVCVAFGKAIPVYSRAQGDEAPRASGVEPQTLVSHAALLRAVEKKIATKRRILESGEASQISKLKEVNAQLRTGQQQLERDLHRGATELAAARAATTELEGVITELDGRLASAADLQSTPVDELVISNAPLHRQMLRLVAEISALEDVLMTVGHGLRTGEVKLPEYLRLTRGVLLRQFNARVLLLKARDVAMMAYQ